MFKNSILVADLLKSNRHVTKLMKNGKVVFYPLQEYKEIINNKARLILNDDSVVEIPFADENDHTLSSTETSGYRSTCKEAIVYDGVTTLDRAFGAFSAMTSCTLPDTITTFEGANLFCDCHVLKRINSNTDGIFNLPKNLSGAMGQGIFARCYNMETLIIPSGVTSLGGLSTEMTGTTGHLKFIFAQPLTAPSVLSNTFNKTPTGGTLYHFCDTPTYNTWMGTGNYYLGKYGWNSKSVSREPMMKVTLTNGDEVECYGTCTDTINMEQNTSRIYRSTTSAIEVYEGVTALELSALSGRTSMTAITLPNSVTSIGKTAFQSCSSLTGLTFPSGLTSIGYGAFSGCRSLAGVEIPSGVTIIDDRAFQSCSALTSITIHSTRVPFVRNADGTTTDIVGVFNNTPIQTIYVPAGLVNGYKTNNGWKMYSGKIQAIP